MGKSYSVSLDTVVREHKLTVVRRGNDYDNIRIFNCDVSRPGLPLAGFYDYFDPTRVQTIGKLELTFLEEMSPEERRRSIDRFMSTGIRFVIVAHGMPVPEEPQATSSIVGSTHFIILAASLATRPYS